MGEWSTCSKDCGSGEQVRLVYCEQIEKVQGRPKTKMVSDNRCAKFIGSKPPVRQVCNKTPCPDWTVSEWSKVSTFNYSIKDPYTCSERFKNSLLPQVEGYFEKFCTWMCLLNFEILTFAIPNFFFIYHT